MLALVACADPKFQTEEQKLVQIHFQSFKIVCFQNHKMSITREEFLTILGVVSHLANSDGEMDPAEKKVLLAIYKAGHAKHSDLSEIRKTGSVVKMMNRLKSDESKLLLVDILALVAGADGVFQDEERVFMGKVMKRLKIDPSSRPYFKNGMELDIKMVRSNVIEILKRTQSLLKAK